MQALQRNVGALASTSGNVRPVARSAAALRPQPRNLTVARATVDAENRPNARSNWANTFSLPGSEEKSAEQLMEEVLERVRKTTAEECPFCADAPGGSFVRPRCPVLSLHRPIGRWPYPIGSGGSKPRDDDCGHCSHRARFCPGSASY